VSALKLWGGIECTINRVGNQRFDQLARGGHYQRADDLTRIAALGIRTLRYPLLWERAATERAEVFDWQFADERLARLEELDIEPIVGLVHHGCGPDHVDIQSGQFARGLAVYAGQLARRHPQLESYTPVNEPLTTARFSGLYGHWYPHARSDRVFARILVNQCRATVLAMRAIREVNSSASLVQTDDLGTIYSTGRLAYQAEFENHRRWLAWDLLCGSVDQRHPLFRYLRGCGIADDELAWFLDNPCPPDIIGIDHYVTSDRFLDESLHRYPRDSWGSNGREAYADVDAVRVLDRPGTSLRHIILDAWQRYRLPLALTEVHIGCTPAEQMRWLDDAWTTSARLAATGVDVRAVTAWCLLGSYDWDSLLTQARGRYEAGAFDVSSGTAQATALAGYIAALTAGEFPVEIARVLSEDGWWRQKERLLYGAEHSIASLVA
jgi:dTDP-4-dehydrorhamnose reductase